MADPIATHQSPSRRRLGNSTCSSSSSSSSRCRALAPLRRLGGICTGDVHCSSSCWLGICIISCLGLCSIHWLGPIRRLGIHSSRLGICSLEMLEQLGRAMPEQLLLALQQQLLPWSYLQTWHLQQRTWHLQSLLALQHPLGWTLQQQRRPCSGGLCSDSGLCSGAGLCSCSSGAGRGSGGLCCRCSGRGSGNQASQNVSVQYLIRLRVCNFGL
jgi:hypothetical protein